MDRKCGGAIFRLPATSCGPNLAHQPDRQGAPFTLAITFEDCQVLALANLGADGGRNV